MINENTEIYNFYEKKSILPLKYYRLSYYHFGKYLCLEYKQINFANYQFKWQRTSISTCKKLSISKFGSINSHCEATSHWELSSFQLDMVCLLVW